MLKFKVWIVLALCGLYGATEGAVLASFPGAKTVWKGYDRFDFEVDGRKVGVRLRIGLGF
jgi:hypothetical protein